MHISNDFYVYVFFRQSLPIPLTYLTIYAQHEGCLIINRNCLPFANIWIQLRSLVGSVLPIVFSFLCCVFLFVCLRPVSCVPNFDNFSCPFLILHSVFCNIYLLVITWHIVMTKSISRISIYVEKTVEFIF